MTKLTILHNPRCSTSRAAVAAAEGHDVEVVHYLTSPLTREDLVDLLNKLEDEPTKLVRRDKNFKEMGLTEDQVQTAEQIVDLLVEDPVLMERPVLIRGDRAIIGRPKERVPDFLNS